MPDFVKLAAPFPSTQISWRVGPTAGDKKSGIALAYLDARDVMDRLDEVCGPAGWQDTYPHAGQKTVCNIGIKCGDEWVWKSDGAGDTQMEEEKGALSDAFKRAGVRWGIGRYLYSLPNIWVEIEPAGKSFRIKQSQIPKLLASLERHAKGLPAPPDIVAEARAISEQQAAERAQRGEKPLRKPSPSRAEWAQYAIEDIRVLDVQGIVDWNNDNAAKLLQLEEQNHSLWMKIDQARADRLDELRLATAA